MPTCPQHDMPGVFNTGRSPQHPHGPVGTHACTVHTLISQPGRDRLIADKVTLCKLTNPRQCAAQTQFRTQCCGPVLSRLPVASPHQPASSNGRPRFRSTQVQHGPADHGPTDAPPNKRSNTSQQGQPFAKDANMNCTWANTRQPSTTCRNKLSTISK
jgi:hypothetical protein